MTNREALKQAYELSEEHPNAEVICMVNGEDILITDDWANINAGIYRAKHDFYLASDELGLDECKIYFRSKDEVEVKEIIEDWQEGEIGVKANKLSNLEWKECIVVEVGAP